MARFGWLFTLVLFAALIAACGTTPTAPAAPSALAVPTTLAATNAPVAATAPALTSAPVATVVPAATTGELTVFAAASLTDAFKAIGQQFSAANGGATVTFNFAGSDQLATQITQGAPADVFASANTKQMEVTIKAGEVISGTQRTFVRNRLVVVYPKDNPGKLSALKDLANPGLKIVLANKNVPVGGYALDFLAKASRLPEYTTEYSPTVLKNVVSYEENVKAVLSKIALGEADAGIVYTTDAATVKDGSIATLTIPDNLNTIATYPIAATKNAKNPELAKKFVEYVLGPAGQQVLVQYGFIPTTGSATGAAPTAAPLAIGGKVDKPMTLTLDAFNTLQQVEIKATDKGGTEQTYKGVLIATLLQQAGVQAGATKVVFTGGDGYTAEVALSALQADKNAIIATDQNGAFRDIIPTQMPKFWVKGLVKLDVQ
ncbi:MAG: molybdate ABC transporter substrate-binding protein [Kouleothrix sp.]